MQGSCKLDKDLISFQSKKADRFQMTKRLTDLILILLFSLSSSAAWSFDKLLCEASLSDWSVYNSLQAKEGILNRAVASIALTRDMSSVLLIRDQQGNKIASILPWNGVVLLKSKMANSNKYKFNFNTDDSTSFSLEVLEPKSSVGHQLSCRFSF